MLVMTVKEPFASAVAFGGSRLLAIGAGEVHPSPGSRIALYVERFLGDAEAERIKPVLPRMFHGRGPRVVATATVSKVFGPIPEGTALDSLSDILRDSGVPEEQLMWVVRGEPMMLVEEVEVRWE